MQLVYSLVFVLLFPQRPLSPWDFVSATPVLDENARSLSEKSSHLRCPSPSIKVTKVFSGPIEITVGRTTDTSARHCTQQPIRGRRTFSDYMDRQQQRDFFHPNNFRKESHVQKDPEAQPERRERVSKMVPSTNLQEILAEQLLTKDLI